MEGRKDESFIKRIHRKQRRRFVLNAFQVCEECGDKLTAENDELFALCPFCVWMLPILIAEMNAKKADL
jgi:hypothetical protein